MRRLSISARAQLSLLFPEMPIADVNVWPALPDHYRREAVIALAELIARAIAATPPCHGSVAASNDERRVCVAVSQGERP